jgi:beta-galactosidase/beta-glucuronidase
MILCEYAHVMGIGPRGLEEYRKVFREYDSFKAVSSGSGRIMDC